MFLCFFPMRHPTIVWFLTLSAEHVNKSETTTLLHACLLAVRANLKAADSGTTLESYDSSAAVVFVKL